ncbi:MAG: helix-turn-helix domain-containing protein [Clostridia bacterium]|nr:helix-turn-helix domain-containing protein [Clostridia bacterium]
MRIQTDNFGYGDTFRCRFHEGIYNYQPHIHQFTEVVVVLDGEIDITVNGRKERATAGDIALIEPFGIHSFETPKHCRIWIAVFSSFYVADFAPENGLREGARSVFEPTRSLFAYVKEHLIYAADRNLYGIKAALYAIFEEYTRFVPAKAQTENKGVLSAVLLYINGHFQKNITLRSLATALGYSQSYLSHVLNTIPNMNFNTLLSSLRIEYAKNLLLTSDRQILDIALECGFSNERSFHRSFRKLVGTTPLAYKKLSLR